MLEKQQTKKANYNNNQRNMFLFDMFDLLFMTIIVSLGIYTKALTECEAICAIVACMTGIYSIL
jgi:hypothetical protein